MDDLLKLQLECDQKLSELIRKEESAILRKEMEILKLNTEMDIRIKVLNFNFQHVLLYLLINLSTHLLN